jgi:phenylalanyl-tRNA synthetase beta chain
MKASVKWLNLLLDGPALSADELDAILTDAGFPIDAREEVPDGDTMLEVEVTSNRGDCLSHEGLAREIAAKTGRAMKHPSVPKARAGGAIAEMLALENRAPEACPRFTARVVRGVTVAPSPAWLVQRLASLGHRSINNIVDVTNYITFASGQPTHVFDLSKLAGKRLVVRWASEGEALTTLDGKKRMLRKDELVVADAERAQSLAGVIGGADSEVGAGTRDVVLEAATWDPVTVRRAARRHQIRTDASHRFERIVDARTIDGPAMHAAALIAELGKGTLGEGALDAGRAIAPLREIALRLDRIEKVLGIAAPAREILARLGMEMVAEERGTLRVRVPAWRPDLEREIDLIEEVGRIHGLDRLPVKALVSVAVRGPQASERAMERMGAALMALGFFETVTFSFVSPRVAEAFLPRGMSLLNVADSRRKEEPTLRPSVLPSLLACRRANQDGGVEQPGGVRLYETAATFAEAIAKGAPKSVERRTLALLMDVEGVGRGKAGTIEQRQRALRVMRGSLESAVRAAAGEEIAINVEGMDAAQGESHAALEVGACGRVMLGAERAAIGVMGVIAGAVQRQFDLAVPVVVAEVDLETTLAARGVRRRIEMPGAFPGIDRDVSLIVGEGVSWAQVESRVRGAEPARLTDVSFVGTYRGKPIDAGKKSVTLRMSFRDETRTLRDDEVTPEVDRVVAALSRELGATLRA